jgi:polysaccharide biosynthesis/export protein
MRKAFISFVLLLSLLAAFDVSAQSTSGEQPTSTSKAATVDPSYTIGPEDVISIAVWKEPDFSSTVPVRPDGNISLQLLGDVKAAGKTPGELATDLALLLKKYIAEPRVTVTATVINSRRAFLLGEINRPGPVVITPGMTVLQAIAAGGGPTAYANTKKIYILRKIGTSQSKLPFNYKEAIKGNVPEQNIALQPGDTIIVP